MTHRGDDPYLAGIHLLKNTIQEYDWGSRTAIAELLGDPTPSVTPQAELWMGAHPKAPSMVNLNDRWVSLKDLINTSPESFLGKAAAERYNNRLPYLFKVLAAAKPLSIQAHPDSAQAKEGFDRENRSGIPLNAPHRNYKDDMHKPEIICALTPFWALNGFRKIQDIILNMNRYCPTGMGAEIAGLKNRPDASGLKQCFESMMTMPPGRTRRIVQEALGKARNQAGDPVNRWIVSLHRAYPDDIGVLAPLYLNLTCLSPGEAMFLPAGQLHAYLEGLGIELMANSDNVLRGGLTPKHVDVPELMKTLRFEGGDVQIRLPAKQDGGEKIYQTPAKEFVLSVLSVKEGSSFRSREQRSAEILICTEGGATLTDLGTDASLCVKKGASVIIPAAVKQYAVEGEAILYKASVNHFSTSGESVNV